jgi:hypothetical protein
VSAIGSLDRRFRRLEWISLAIALASGTGLVIAALLAPVYQSQSVSSPGAMTNGSATLVAVNGWGALLVAGAPLAAAVVTGYGLWRRAGRPGAGILAWTVTGLLACFNVLAMATIGVFVVPVTVALFAACAVHGGWPHGEVTR